MMDRNTRYFDVVSNEENPVRSALVDVYRALQQKGYNPVNQITGYLISGDPTYITAKERARFKIQKLEKEAILEDIVRWYLEHRLQQPKPEDMD